MRLRSLLFVPGDRPDRMEKALGAGADALILDLEDAVAAARKAEAREAVAAFLARPDRPLPLFVRINPVGGRYVDDDLAMLRTARADAIMLPKAEGATSIHALSSWTGLPILPIATETPAAIFALGSYVEVRDRLIGLTWGAEDLPAAIGATAAREADGRYTPPIETARSLALFAAHAAGVAAIETVYPAFHDLDGLAAYAARGARDGFTGMMAIHPDQVAVINRAFTPGSEAIAAARTIVDAFAADPEAGVLAVEGRMVDAPHLARARRLLEQAGEGIEAFDTLIDAAALARLIADDAVSVFDCRYDLTDPDAGRAGYRGGHIKGSLYADLGRDLSAPPNGRNGRHPLPDREAFARRMAELGLDRGRQVVSYDTSGGFYAARLWWMLRWAGHEAAAVLDGGLQAWIDAGLPVEEGEGAKRPAGTFVASSPLVGTADVAEIEANLAGQDLLVIDARAPDRFAGAPDALDPVAGHIPGARNRFYRDNLGPDGRFKPADTLKREWSAVLDGVRPERIVSQCGSGVTATHNLLALEIAGLGGARLYPGSWSEWISDPSRPTATGPA